MATVALIGGRRVIAGFGGTDATAHMATDTLIGGLTVIKRQGHRQPACGSMASIALVGCQRMGGRLIGGVGPGMTGCATVRGLGVIKRCDERQEQIRGMANVT